MRVGNWKGVLQRGKGGPWAEVLAEGGGTWSLFDLSADVSEVNDVAAANPEVIARLAGIAKREHTPAQPGTYTDRSAHIRDRDAKWGTSLRTGPSAASLAR